MVPPFLKPGDKVAIVSPSGAVDKQYIDGAVKVLSDWKLIPVIGEYAYGKEGRYSGTV